MSKNADLRSLSEAQNMERAGTDSEEIRQKTGWFRGADNKWRFEIDDSGMEFRKDGDARLMQEPGYQRLQELTDKWADSFDDGAALSAEESAELEQLQAEYTDRVWEDKYMLTDFVKHDELYERYPRLRGVSLIFDDLAGGTKGFFSKRSNTIVLSNELFGKEADTVLHEIQHVIQKIEGFAGGSSPEYWRKRMEDGYSRRWSSGEEMMPTELYENTAGEIEARDAAKRREYTAEQRWENAPDTGNEDTVFAEGNVNSFSIDPKFAESIDSWDGKTDTYFRLGTTSDALKSIGVQDKKIVFRSDKLKAILNKHEGMDLEVIKQVPNILEYPNMVLNSRSATPENKGESSRVVLFGEVYDSNGAPVTAILELRPTLTGGEIQDYNLMVSTYGKTKNLHKMVEESEVLYLNPDKKRTDTWLHGLGLQLPSFETKYGSIGSIAYEEGFVNIKGVPWTEITNGALPFKTGASSKKGLPGGDAPSLLSLRQKAVAVKENGATSSDKSDSYGRSFDELVSRSGAKASPADMKRSVDELMDTYNQFATKDEPKEHSTEEAEAIAAAKVMTDYKDSHDSPVEAGRKAWSFIKRKMIDSGEAVQRVAKATGDRYLYAYYDMARASSNAAVSMIVDAQTDITGKRTGDSLNSIFDPIMGKGKEYYNAFQNYLYHRHNVDRRSRNRDAETEEARRLWLNYRQNHPELQYYSDQQLAKMAVDETSTMYEQAGEYLRLLREYNQAQKTVDKPVFGWEVTAEDSQAIADRLQREHPEFAQEAEKVYKYIDGLLRYRVDSGLITEGSYQQLKKLYPHYVPTYRAGQESQYSTARENTVEIGKTIKRAEGGENALMPLHTALARQTYSVVREGSKNRFGQRLMEQRTNGTSASKLIGEVTEYEGSFNADDFDALEDETPKKDNTFIVNEGGKEYKMEVSPELFEGIKALSPDKEETNVIIRMVAAGNNAYKQLITGMNPTFMARNFVRDLQDAGLYTKDFGAFAANYFPAIKQIATNGEYWQRYKALGGTHSSIFDYQTGTVKKEGALRKNTIGRVEALNMAVEQAPRLAEFMATLKKGDGSLDNIMEAMYNAADVTTNFGRSGTWGKWLNRYWIPFFNPAIQGTDKFIRRFTETKGAKQWAGLITKCAALGVAPAILNGILHGDDEEWEDIHQSDKDTNYLFKLKDGLWLKIPKGRALSMFGMVTDRVEQEAKGEEVDYAEFINTAASQMAPTNPLKENVLTDWFNTKLFDPKDPGETWYGSDIENQRMQGYEPGQRYDSKTDEVSKWIGEKTGLSPKKINYLLQQYTGVVGDLVLPLLTPSAERDMFSAAFTIDSNYSNELSTRFYDTFDQLEFAKNAEGATAADVAVYRYWNKVSGSVSDINAAIREIEADESLSGKEKREQLAGQYAIRNALEKNALETLASYEEAVSKHFSEFNGNADNAADYAYLMANREMFGSEYAIQSYNKAVYERAKGLEERGLDYDVFFDYYFTGFGVEEDVSELQKLRTVGASGLNDYQLDTAFRLLMSDSQYRGWTKIDDSTLTVDDYIDGLEIEKNAVGKKDANGATIEGSETLAVMQGIDGLDIEDGEKQLLFEAMGHKTGETMWNTEYEGDDYETYYYMSGAAKADYNSWCSWMEVSEFDEYYAHMSALTGDKDANGKTISGSLQRKRIEYIDSLDLWPDEKSALYRCFYDTKTSLSKCTWYNPIAMRGDKFPTDWK